MGGSSRPLLSLALVAIADPSDLAMDSLVSRVVPAGLDPPARFYALEALVSHGIDALVIVTPHTQHAGQIARALVSGIHVLCEKPLATTAADARRSMDLASAHERVLAIGYQRHGQAQFRQARELVTSGALGDIRLISVLIAQDCLENFIPGSSWRADPALSGGGHFIDTGSHIVDQMLWISDLEPERVYAEIDNFGTDVDVITASRGYDDPSVRYPSREMRAGVTVRRNATSAVVGPAASTTRGCAPFVPSCPSAGSAVRRREPSTTPCDVMKPTYG